MRIKHNFNLLSIQDRVNGTNGYEEEEEDHEEKAALLEMFIEMAAIDEVSMTTLCSYNLIITKRLLCWKQVLD